MAEIKLDYVNTFYDARGKLRHQFRRKGHKKETIKGRSGSQEFMDAYHALLDKTGGAIACRRDRQGQAQSTLDSAERARAARPELAGLHAKAVEAAGERYAKERGARTH